jgi:outer membrane protein assembly factor BamD (BamD/ComL family)
MKGLFAIIAFGLIAGCGKPSAEESFGAGEMAQKQAEQSLGTSPQSVDSLFMTAIGHYEQVVENHPDHPLAESALFRIAELHNNGTRRFQEAIATYRRFLSAFPESPQAPVSLFMVAFLYNNELHDLNNAGAAYREFLSRYPNHELAPSASGELENLGKSPEQIIEQQVALLKNEAKTGTAPPEGKQENQ